MKIKAGQIWATYKYQTVLKIIKTEYYHRSCDLLCEILSEDSEWSFDVDDTRKRYAFPSKNIEQHFRLVNGYGTPLWKVINDRN